MPIEAVVFDWGGTLSYWADVDLADMWRLAARHIDPEREEDLAARLAAVEAASFARTRTDQRSSALPDILREASGVLGIDVAEAVLEEAALHHLDTWTPHVVHDPAALPVLAALKAEGLRTGLLSNTHWPRSFHEHFLERDGLAEHLDARLYTSEMSHTKPHPKAFRAAAAAIGVEDLSRVVFVGDREFDDIYGARMCGMRTVLRQHRHSERYEHAAPDAVIGELPELLPLVDAWRSDR